MSSPIEIIGGGLSGLMLGLKLRRKDIPVTLHEAGDYPRHRVCGEFLSGSGVEILKDEGLLSALEVRGALWGQDVAFYSESGLLQRFSLSSPALCLSRFAFDQELARLFEESGGELRTGNRLRLDPDKTIPGTIWATGRRRKATDSGWRWFGLKMHARDVPLEADLEMHLHPDAYVGACRIEDDRVNLCGLFRNSTDGSSGRIPTPRHCLRGLPGSPLWERTANATFLEESRCSVAGLDLHPHRAAGGKAFRVGDSITMIPPLTGNGMSMALESASAAAEPLTQFSRGELSWEQTLSLSAKQLDFRFESRLAWAQRIQRMLFSPIGRPFLLTLGRQVPLIWQMGFQKTR